MNKKIHITFNSFNSTFGNTFNSRIKIFNNSVLQISRYKKYFFSSLKSKSSLPKINIQKLFTNHFVKHARLSYNTIYKNTVSYMFQFTWNKNNYTCNIAFFKNKTKVIANDDTKLNLYDDVLRLDVMVVPNRLLFQKTLYRN